MDMKCIICTSTSPFFAQGVMLGKYSVSYFRCENCGFVQTEAPYWFNEAYSDAINRSDVGLVSRNIMFSKITKALIVAFFNPNSRFIDYGGGYGLFVRMMSDYGFDFYWFDEYCSNLFAQGLEHHPAEKIQYELLTAFEVFEHLKDPVNEISKMLLYSRNILFTTELLPSNPPLPHEWRYYGLEHGQHISFFTERSLSAVARTFGLNFYTNGRSLHLLTDRTISQPMFNIISRHKIASFLHLFLRKKSLTGRDYEKAVSKTRLTGDRS